MALPFRLRWVIAFLLTGVMLAAAHTAVAVSMAGLGKEKLAFTITRNGTPIGSHTYSFQRDGGRTTVNIKTDIDFRFLSLPLYRFRHESREIWEGDQLLRLVSNTNDNGSPVALDVRADGQVLKVDGQGEAVEVDSRAIPASLWNPVVVKRHRLLDTVNGAVLTTDVVDLGDEVLPVGGQSIPVRRYRLTGDYQRDVWYDRRDGTLVRVLFRAKDGSDVEYVPVAESAVPQGS